MNKWFTQSCSTPENTVCKRCTIIGVWNDCKVYMFDWQVSSDFDLIFIMFMVLWLKFLCFVSFSYHAYTVWNRSSMFIAWKYFMMYMSVRQACLIWPWPHSNGSLPSVKIVFLCPIYGHYVFWSVHPSVRSSVRPSICPISG